MSQSLFTIIGDSNVVDNMTSFNTASREAMKSAQVIPVTTLGQLPEAFQSIRCGNGLETSKTTINAYWPC